MRRGRRARPRHFVVALAAVAVVVGLGMLAPNAGAGTVQGRGIGTAHGRGTGPKASALPLNAPAQGSALLEAYRLEDRWTSSTNPPPSNALLRPTGVTVDTYDGSVYVADTGNNRVQVYSEDGAFLRSLGDAPGEPGALDEPLDVAVQGSAVFVTDSGHDRVALFTIDGSYSGEWAGIPSPWGIAAAADGRVLVSEGPAGKVTILRTDGARLGEWQFGTTLLRGIDVMPDGRAALVDAGARAVYLIRPDGTEQRASATLPASPFDVAVDAAGSLWLTLGDGRLARLEDQLDLPISSTEPLAGAIGVATGSPDLVYASFQDDTAPLHGVSKWGGRPLAALETWGAVPAPLGTFNDPYRLAAGNSVLAADAWRRIQRLDTDGTAIEQIPAGGVNDMAEGPGSAVFVAKDGEISRVDSVSGSTDWTWAVPAAAGQYAWIVAVDWDPAVGVLAALDVGRQRFWMLDADGNLMANRPLVAGGAVIPLWDLARGATGYYAVNRRADAVETRDSQGALLGSWPVPGGALRVASDDAGSAFVLNRRGWIIKFDAAGNPLAAWQAGDPADPESRVVDIAVDALGRVLALDRGLERIDVYTEDPTGNPGTLPSFIARCAAGGDKWADPTHLQLGDETAISLSIDGNCPAVDSQADIVLAIDVSGSMSAPAVGRPGTKMDAAKDAAASFVALMDFGSFRVGVTAFNSAATLVQPLTDNPVEARAAVMGLAASGGTDIGAGVDSARDELTGPRRRLEVEGVIILLTDGFSDPLQAMRAADQARLEGVRLFTVGFGQNVNAQLLRDMATSPADYYNAPTAADLEPIYQALAERIAAAVLFSNLTVVDELPDNMAYVDGSGVPAPSVNGQTLVWTLSDVPMSGTVLTYRVRPAEVGVWPTNRLASGDGTDGLGQPGQVAFPVPEVDVVAPTGPPPPTPTPTDTPTPSATPTRGPTPTPTVTPEPRSIYLPALRNEVCVKRRQHVDVVLIIDTSNSMLEKTSAARTKLEAAADAAGGLVDLLEMSPSADTSDAAAVVYFNGAAAARIGLSRNPEAVRSALSGLPQAGGTRIDLGLDTARSVLAGPDRNPANIPVAILLTDGVPSGTTPEAVIAAADALRPLGAVIYAIGLGPDVDSSLLGQITQDKRRVILAPDAEDLARIYSDIARELPCVRP